jgi:hypothetical protein
MSSAKAFLLTPPTPPPACAGTSPRKAQGGKEPWVVDRVGTRIGESAAGPDNARHDQA